MPNILKPNIAIVLVAKTPELGKVKTRLAKDIGNQEALNFHVAFTNDCLSKISLLNLDCYIYLTHPWDSNVAPYPEILEANKCTLRYQVAGDLGTRLKTIFLELFSFYQTVIVMGIDSPNLPLAYLKKTILTFAEHDCVLGPAVDGGYYLIGLKREIKDFSEIFYDIAWGTEKVFLQTLSHIKRKNLTLYTLPPWYDVDTLPDLLKLKRDLSFEDSTQMECVYTQKFLNQFVM